MTFKKTSVRCHGLLAGLVLFVTGFLGAFAQTSIPVEGAEYESFRTQVDTAVKGRIAVLNDATLEELEEAEQQASNNMEEWAAAAATARMEALNAYQEANANAPEVRAIRGEIQDLDAKIAITIREMPEVKAKYEAIGVAEKKMLEESEFRRQLRRLINSKRTVSITE